MSEQSMFGFDLGTLAGAAEQTEISRPVYAFMWQSGSALIVKHREFLNKINLFPIPDSDTGNNMALAFREFAQGAKKSHDNGDSCLGISQALGLSMLFNAQGNSGTISTYFFNKMVAGLEVALNDSGDSGGSDAGLSVAVFAAALESAGSAMQSAMDNPKPGTMISVMQDSTIDLAAQAAAAGGTLGGLLQLWFDQATVSLLKTPDQLEVDGKFILKDAGVDFDSGAKGFVLLIEGMLKAVNGDPVAMPEKEGVRVDGSDSTAGIFDAADSGHEDVVIVAGQDLKPPHNRFCTEFLVELPADTSVDEAAIKVISHIVSALMHYVHTICTHHTLHSPHTTLTSSSRSRPRFRPWETP
jgi:dihydroxyacetone kinase-like predicted kinase